MAGDGGVWLALLVGGEAAAVELLPLALPRMCGGILASGSGGSLSCECALYGEPGSDASSLEPVLESAQLSEVATPLQKGEGEVDKYTGVILCWGYTTDTLRDFAGPYCGYSCLGYSHTFWTRAKGRGSRLNRL